MYSYIKAMQLRVKFLKQGIWENMMNVNKIEAVTERDIDLLLLE